MFVYMKGRCKSYMAEGEYDPQTNELVVYKGALINKDTNLPMGKGGRKWERLYRENTINGVLKQDIVFRSPSSAATFVSGTNSNGCLRWKTASGMPISKSRSL